MARSTARPLRRCYAFRGGSDGDLPSGSLVSVIGTLYGTTEVGGGPKGGYGTVFSITPRAVEKVIYAFHPPDASGPQPGLTKVRGMLYGTAGGGAYYCGDMV